jgi:hypothetical protein
MKRTSAIALPLLLFLCLTLLPGCPPAPPKAAAPLAPNPVKNDSQRFGVDLLRQTVDPARCWEGLQLINSSFQRPAVRDRLVLSADYRKALVDLVHLDDEEVQEVASPTFRWLDAHHVAECLLLRDAARGMEVAGTPPPEMADAALRWVQRHVLLHEQHDDWLPPAAVLRRGYGSSSDRVRVLVALLQQMQMKSCLFVLPEVPDEIVLVGTVPTGSKDVLLLDPRRASAVRTAGGAIATWKDVAGDSKLRERSGLTEAQLKAAEVRLALPLAALSFRMRELEQILGGQVALAIEPTTWEQLFRDATGRPVRVWNGPAASDNSPTRALRFFLPPEQGGIDKTDRLKRFQNDLFPATSIRAALEQIHLGRGELPDAALAPLLKIINHLFEKYDRQPQDMLLRGKREDVKHRLDRIRTFLEAENLNLHGAANDPDVLRFQQAVAKWRGRVIDAFAALAANPIEGQKAVNAVWGEDQYVLALLNVDEEEPPDRYQKTPLTSILAYLTRDYLSRRAWWLTAMAWHDEADRAERRAARAPAGKAPGDAKSAWKSARTAWDVYLDRAALGPDARQSRLQPIQTLLKSRDLRGPIDAAHLLEELHLDLHRYFAARLNFARAVERVDGTKAPRPILTALDEDLGSLLEKDKNGKTGLQADVDSVAQGQRAGVNSAVTRSLQLLQSDWAPHGSYYWLRVEVRAQ